MAELLPNLVQRFFDSNGVALVGGKLYSYAAGTSIPLATYTDQGALTPNANPTVLDASGGASVFIPIGVGYKFILQDSLGNVIKTVDNVYFVEPGGIGAGTIAAGAITTSLLADANVTTAKLQDGAVTTAKIANAAVTGTKIASGTIEASNLDPAIDFSSLTKMIEVVIKNKSDLSGAVFEAVPLFPWSAPSKLSNPSTLPGNDPKCLAWSPCGRFLAIGNNDISGGVFQLYERTGSTLNLLTTPFVGTAQGLSWSPKGDFLALTQASSTIAILRRQGNVFTQVRSPISVPPGNGLSAAWSANGEFLAIGSSLTGFLTVYQINFSELSDGNTILTATNLACADATLSNPVVTSSGYSFSAADIGSIISITSGTNFTVGNYEIIALKTAGSAILGMPCGTGVGSSGHFSLIPTSGPIFTALAAPATAPGSKVNALAFSPDSQFLAVCVNSSPFILIYQITGSTLTALSSPVTLTEAPLSVKFSPDNKFLAIGTTSSPFILLYSISGTTFTHLSNPANLPAGSVNALSFSPNGLYLLMGLAASPYVYIYSISGTTFTPLANPGSLPSGASTGAGWSPTMQFLALCGATTPYLTVYQTSASLPTNALLWVRNMQNV